MAFTVTVSRSSAHRERFADSAAFGLVCAQIPTGYTHAEVDYKWRFTDEAGPYSEYGHTQNLRVFGDGSASYVVGVDLYVIDKLTEDVLDDDGTTIDQSSGPVPSATLSLTVTDNSAADLWDVTKAGDDIEADDGSTTLYADEVVGNDTTGNGTIGTPWRTITKIIAEADANATVWSVGSGTYAWTGRFTPSTTSNREISGAPGSTVTFVPTGGFIQYGVAEPNSGSDLRLAGFTVTPASYVASALVTFGNNGEFEDFSLFDVTATNLEVGLGWTGDCDMDGIYVHGWDMTNSEFTIFGGGRVQFLGVCDFDLTQTQYVGASQSMFRLYQVRYSCWHRGTISKGSGNPATFRFSAIDESVHGPWGNDGTVANGGFWNSFRDFTVAVDDGVDEAHDLFTFSADSSYTGDWSSRFWEWVNLDFWHDRGGRGIRADGNHSHARDWLIANCRAGRDPGSSTNDRGGLSNWLWIDEFVGTTVRERIRVVHCDVVLYKYRASDWSNLYHTGAVKAGQAFLDFSRNLTIYNVISQTFPAEFNPTLPNTALCLIEENAWCKTDQYSGTNARSEIVRHSGGTDRTQAQWVTDGIDVNATGYTIAHSTVASTHYDFTAYRTRAGAAWEGAATKSPYVRLDVAGNVRGSTTTPGRYDPDATADTIGDESSVGEIFPDTVGPATQVGTPTLSGQIRPSVIAATTSVGTPTLSGQIRPSVVGPATQVGTPTLHGQIRPSTIAAATTVGTPSLSGEIRPATVGPFTVVGEPTLTGPGLIAPATVGPATEVGEPTLSGQIRPATLAATTAVGSPTLSGQIRPDVVGPFTTVGEPTVSGPNNILPVTIAATTAVGAPTLSGQIRPATIAAVTSVGAPTIAGIPRPTSRLHRIRMTRTFRIEL